MILGVLFIIVLIALAIWQLVSKWRFHRRLTLYGFTVQARVTDIKREARLVTQFDGLTSTHQRLKYEDFLYAQWQDPITQNAHKFRINIPDFYQFHIGEVIPIKMNRNNSNEYQIAYSKYTTSQKPSIPKTPLPKTEVIHHDYQQGYQVSILKPEAQKSVLSNSQDYEEPKASYPQQLLEQKNDGIV